MESVINKVIIITGASRGIGAATAICAAKAGYNVCVNYNKSEKAAREVVKQIRNFGSKALAVKADMRSEEEIVNLFKKARRELGYINILINNAGIVAPSTRVENMTAERINNMLHTNVTAPFLCAREAVKYMSLKNGGQGGVILNVSSVAAHFGSPNEYVDYAASKAALDVLTIGLAKEVAQEGIRVVGVRPGITKTDLHGDSGDINRPERLKDSIPMKRPGLPEEIARAIVWMVSDEASYITGSILDVSGGR
jgi:NAD(P)-dependent dehydrogenase (short-subunit alcohol dehydrogenase family)